MGFEEISSKLQRVPAWMDRSDMSVNDTAVFSLRPPRIPKELTSEARGFIAHEAANDWVEDSEPAGEASEQAYADVGGQAEESTENRRIDTLIEEIVPRVDEEAVVAIRDAVAKLVSERQRAVQGSEQELAKLVAIISQRVVARELHIDPTVIRGMVREGLGALAASDHITVRVGEFFAEVAPQLEREVARAGVSSQVIVDAALGQYGCRIETEWGVVDESVEARLQTLLESISIAPPPRR